MNDEEKLDNLSFSEALIFLKQGAKLTRKGWNKKGLWVEMQVPDEHSKMTRPYIFMNIPLDNSNTVDKVPWLVSQTDLFVHDWEVVA